MATEMDALSLSITASTRDAVDKIDNLIASLKNLDTRFRSLSGSTTYANNLETAVHSIARINNAISNIDDNKLKSVASALKSLGTAGNNLANFGSITQAGKAMDTVSAKAENMAKSLAASFKITDKDHIDSLTASIRTMINTMGKGEAFYAAEDSVKKLIEDYGLFENKLHDVEGTYEKVRNIIRQQPLYVPDNFTSNADWLSDLATIGIKNTTHDKNAGISAGYLASQLESLIPALQGLQNESDIISTIANHLRDATSASISFAEATKTGQDADAWYRLNEAVRQTEQSLGIVAPTMEEIDQYLKTVNFDAFTTGAEQVNAMRQATYEYRDSLQAAATTVQELSNALQQSQQNAQPFDRIVNGLSQLEDVHIGDFSNISVLADGVNKLGYQSAINASQTLPLIADGLRQFENFTLPELGDMDSFSRGLRSLGSKAVQNAANALPFIADGLRQLRNIGDLPHSEGLQEFAQSLSIFGRQTSERAVQTIPQLTHAFQQLFETMSRAPRISQNTIDAANAMANLASRTGGVTRALNSANPALRTWSSNAGRATKSSFSLASAIGRVYATYWMLFRAFGMAGKAINIASDMTEVKNVVVQAFGDMAYKANEFARIAGESFGMSKLQALDAASRYQAMGKTMGITDRQIATSNDFLRNKLSDTLAIKEVQQAYGDLGNTAADMSINLTRLAGDLASLYNTDIDVAAEKLNSIFTGTTKPLRDFGFDLTQATLQEWALTNGINANVKSMTQAEKAVLRYQYVMANASFVMGDFVRTADSWHNSIVRMKLAFSNLGSVIGQGFINLLKPAVQRITAFVNTVTKLVEKAINAIGKLLGWQVNIDPVKAVESGDDGGIGDLEDAMGDTGSGAAETADAMDDADKSAESTADNLDKAQKAAKKMKDYLLGIDELNVFQPDQNTDTDDKDKTKKNKTPKNKSDKGKSGGGGGGSKGGGASEGGATGGGVSIEKYESDIKSWFGLGKKIGDALSKAMEGIDWDKIYKKAEHFGTGLASFLNGLISPRLFGNLGKTIANSLNTALHFLDSFGKHFDWKNFGTSIAAGINNFFKHFDFKLLASVLNTWALGLLETLITALKKTDWEMIGEKIGEFLVNIKWLKIAQKVAEAIWEAINAAFKLYKGMFSTAPLETAILSVVGVIGLLKSNVVVGAINCLKGLAEGFSIFYTYARDYGVIEGLAMTFPTLGNAIEIARQGLLAFTMAYEGNQGLFKSLSAGFGEISSNISPLGKLLLTAAGGLVEFLTVSDGIKGIITGTQSLASSFAEIAVGIGVAATAFTLAFGFPAGLIATAIVGVVASIKGISDAFNEIDTKRYAESVNNALSRPGGVPIEDLIGTTRESLQSLGDSFGELANKAEQLDSVDGQIADIGTEIETLNIKLKGGTITQEEYTQRIADCYSRLAQAIQTKLGDAEYYVVAALGEGSPVSEALKNQGVNVDDLASKTIESAGEIKVKMQELIEKLSTLDPSNPNYAKYQKELLELASGEDDVSQATLALQTATSKSIDWATFIDEDGALKVNSIKGILGEVSDKAEDVKSNAEISMNGVVTAMKNAGNEAGAEEVKNAIPKALSEINDSVSEECLKMTDTLQRDAIDGMNKVIDDAIADWSSLSPLEKANWDGSLAKFTANRVNAYKSKVIDPLSESIDTELGELGIEGAGWASDAADAIIEGALTDHGAELNYGEFRDLLETSWKNGINEAAQLSYETAEEGGKHIAEGIGSGMADYDMTHPIRSIFDMIWDGICNIFGIGSPAKEMYPLGNDIMAGIISGFEEYSSQFKTAISNWYNNSVKPWFTLDKWKTLGANITTGLMSKWNEFVGQWKTAIGNWWNQNVVPWLKLDKWKTEADHIKVAIISKFTETVNQWIIDIGNWWNQNVVPWLKLDKWKAEADHIREAIITKFNETVKQWIIAIGNWWNQNVVPWLKLDKWKAEADHIREAIITKFTETVRQWAIDIANWWNQHVVPWLDIKKWKAEADHIRDAIVSKLSEMISEWAGKISNWWSNNVVPYFSLDKWKELGNNVKNGIINAIDEAIGEWKGKVQEFVKSFQDVFKESTFKEIGTKCMNAVLDGFKAVESQIKTWAQGIKDWIQGLWNSITINQPSSSDTQQSSSNNNSNDKKKKSNTTKKKASGGILVNGDWRNIHAYGSGGIPDEGQLFWARESGAELVGQIGGNTAVMNNDQIVASVSSGVQQAVTEALAPYLADISRNTKTVANKDFSIQIGDRQIAEANNRGQRQLGAVLFT